MSNINKEEAESINKEVIKPNNQKEEIKADILKVVEPENVIPYIPKNEGKFFKPVIKPIIHKEIKKNTEQNKVQPKINPMIIKSNIPKAIQSNIHAEIRPNFSTENFQYDFHPVKRPEIQIDEIPEIPQIIPNVIQQDFQPINLSYFQPIAQIGKTHPNIGKKNQTNSSNIQTIIKKIIQPVIIQDIQPIIIEIIQPLYYINKKQYFNNLKSLPVSLKNNNLLKYPLNDMDKKYLQNIDLLYIEMQFRNAEQEYLKNDNAILEQETTIDKPIYEPTYYENSDIIFENNPNIKENIINEILPQKIIEYIKIKKIKYFFHKYIEIKLIEDNSI